MPSGLEAELLIRVVATAVIVIGITLSVERLGPVTGGALAGLPIVIGPAFFFLLREQSVAFSADVAAASLTSLAGTQAFLLGYVATAARSRAAIGAASVAWVACAWLLSWMPQSPFAGLAVFGLAMVSARSLSSRFTRPHATPPVRGNHMTLVLRGVAAGLLVAVVTLAAGRLGPLWAGFLITYPIGLTVISVTIHQRSGADMAISTLRAVMLGISSLAAFVFTLSVALPALGPAVAFAAALGAGTLVTTSLVRASRPRSRPVGDT